MNSKPSEAHRLAVKEGRLHHQSSKTYSGSLMRPHVPYLAALIERKEIASALDYGCGKGEQYLWRDPKAGGRTVEERFGFEVRKYDPCWPPFAAEPEGQFDLVICTHTLSLIPLADQEWALRRMFALAGKAIFIAEKIGERKKHEVMSADQRAIGWSVARWLDRLAPIADQHQAIELVFSSRERIGDAAITIRHTRRNHGWHAEVAGGQ